MTYYNKENGRKNMRLHGYDYSRAGLYFLTIVVQNRLQLFGHIEKCELLLNDAGIMIEKWYREIENKFPDKRCREMVVMPNHFHCIIENIETGANNSIWDNRISKMDARVSSSVARVSEMDAHVSSSDANVSEKDARVSEMDAHVSSTDARVSEMDANVSEMDANVALSDAHVSSSDARVSEMDAHVGAPLRGHPGMYAHPGTDSRPDSHPNSNEYENTETDVRNNTGDKYGLHNKKYGATIGDVMDWFKTMTTNEYIRGVKNNNWQRFEGKLWQRNYYDHIIRDWQDDVRISTYIIENPAKWKDDRFNI